MDVRDILSLEEARQLLDRKWLALNLDDVVAIERAFAAAGQIDLRERPELIDAYLASLTMNDVRTVDPELRRGLARCAQVVPVMASVLQESDDAELVLATSTSLMLGCRLRGELARAEAIGEVAALRIDNLSARETLAVTTGSESKRPGSLEMQRGMTAMMLGDFARAIAFYRQAIANAGPPPYRHFAGIIGASNAAMLAALEGYHELSLGWLKEADILGPVDGWAGHLTLQGAHAARALMAVDSLDKEQALRHLELLGPATGSVEQWRFIVAVDVAAELAFGDPHVAYAQFRAAGFSHGVDLTSDPGIDHLTFRAYLDLLIAMGESATALRLAKEAGTPTRTHLPIARAYLTIDQPMEAARFAGAAIHGGELSMNDLREAFGVLAAAQLRIGETEEAQAAFTVFAKARTRYHRAMARRLPVADMCQLQDLTGISFGATVGATAPGTRAEAAHLTPKEHQVLQLLADGLSTGDIAERTSTSPQTVRTHLKRVFRKLGVSSRAEAVMKGELTGLLGWSSAK